MTLHVKKKAKLHVKEAPEVKSKGQPVQVREGNAPNTAENNGNQADPLEASGDRQKPKMTDRKSMRKNAVEKAGFIVADHAASVAHLGTHAALEQVEGGEEIYQSCQAAAFLCEPVRNTSYTGKKLYHQYTQAAAARKLKRVESGEKIGKRNHKKSFKIQHEKSFSDKNTEALRKDNSTAKGPKKTEKGRERKSYSTGSTHSHKRVGLASRERKLKFFMDKMNAEEEQKDSLARLVKDLVAGRVTAGMKAAAPIIGLCMAGLAVLIAIAVLPVIAFIAVLYNSPFAVFLPSISSAETTGDVLSGYIAEFDSNINAELSDSFGYDSVELVYRDYDRPGTPDNYADILAVYMVKHGIGDTATDMTNKAKRRLKAVFEDMCSYSVSDRTEKVKDDKGKEITLKIKVVEVSLKTYTAMAVEYGFDAKEQEMLAEIMKMGKGG